MMYVTNRQEEDLADKISIGCCTSSDNPDASVESPCEAEEFTYERQNSATRKHIALRWAQLASKSLTDGDYCNTGKFHCMYLDSRDECNDPSSGPAFTDYRQGADPKLLSMPSLLDDSEGDYHRNIDGLKNDDTATICDPVTTCSQSSSTMGFLADAIALDVGRSAYSYLEECFHTEAAILDKEKFNAVPEITQVDLIVTGFLGQGSYSNVFEVLCDERLPARGKRNGFSAYPSIPPQFGEHMRSLAMKSLQPRNIDPEQFTIGAEDLIHETAMLASLDHPNIIKLHGRAFGQINITFALNGGFFILLDRLKETLKERIHIWKRDPKCALQEPSVTQIEAACSIAGAMSYLHSKNIIFRDLKPENVGFDRNGVVKLFDFGFAVGLPEANEVGPATGLLYDRCGTLRYMAPEVGLSLGYSLPADVYSFGIIFWAICSLRTPFSSIKSPMEFAKAVFVGRERPKTKDKWPPTMKVLMSSCWTTAPSRRPSMLNVKSTLKEASSNRGW